MNVYGLPIRPGHSNPSGNVTALQAKGMVSTEHHK